MVIPKSPNNVTKPSASVEALTIANNSDSAELLAMTACVLLQDFNTWDPTIAMPPLVDLRVLRHPAQLASEYTSNTLG